MQSLTTTDGVNITIIDYPAMIVHRVYTDEELNKIEKWSKQLSGLHKKLGIKLICNGKEFNEGNS